jgi:hypothetical protein
MSAPIASGYCACGSARFEMLAQPFAVHACHCTYCQRETGATFAHNALVESDAVKLTTGQIETIETPTASGRVQNIIRCSNCHSPLWSHYPVFEDRAKFVRVGALEDPAAYPPDVHIFASSKPPWLRLPEQARAFERMYPLAKLAELFGEEDSARWRETTQLTRAA